MKLNLIYFISTAISIGANESLLDEESEKIDEKLPLPCYQKTPLTKENITALLQEGDEAVAHLKDPNTLEYQRLLYFQSQSINEAHTAALKKDALEYYHKKTPSDFNLQPLNSAYPTFLHSEMQQCDAATPFSNPHLPDEVTTYFNKKMESIYERYSNILWSDSFITEQRALFDQEHSIDCATNHTSKVPLKQPVNELLQTSFAPNSNHAHTA